MSITRTETLWVISTTEPVGFAYKIYFMLRKVATGDGAKFQ